MFVKKVFQYYQNENFLIKESKNSVLNQNYLGKLPKEDNIKIKDHLMEISVKIMRDNKVSE